MDLGTTCSWVLKPLKKILCLYTQITVFLLKMRVLSKPMRTTMFSGSMFMLLKNVTLKNKQRLYC